jgi:hypothetical protein
MNLSPPEVMFLGAAFGWVIAASMFMLIPSWRVRDVRNLSNDELCALCDETLAEMKRRSWERESIEQLEHCRQVVLAKFPPRLSAMPHYDDYYE